MKTIPVSTHQAPDFQALLELLGSVCLQSAVSILLARGVQLAEVSKLLGHSELRVTSDLYTHLMRETATKAASHMDAVLSR